MELDLWKSRRQTLEIANVPSVEQSSTMTSSRSIFSGSERSTQEMQRSTTVREL